MIRQRRQAEKNKILLQVSEKYRDLFQIHDRVFSKEHRHVAIVDPERYDEFMGRLAADEEIPVEVRAAIGVALSGGLRVTELVGIRRVDIEADEDGSLFFYTGVLKKRKAKRTERPILIHNDIVPLVRKAMEGKPGFAKIFDLNRRTVWTHIKKYLGEALDCHALRHSHISWLAFEKKLTTQEICEVVKLSPQVASAYAHLDVKRKLKRLARPKG